MTEFIRTGKPNKTNWQIRKLVGKTSGSLTIENEHWDNLHQRSNIVFRCSCCHTAYKVHSLAAAQSELKRGVCIDCFSGKKRRFSPTGEVYFTEKKPTRRRASLAQFKATELIVEVSDTNGNKYHVNQKHLEKIVPTDFMGL